MITHRLYRHRGYAGLIMLVLVVLIIGLLASTLLKQYLGPLSSDPGKGPRGVSPETTAADPPLGSTSTVPAAAIQRANALGAEMQQQAAEQAKRIDEIESK